MAITYGNKSESQSTSYGQPIDGLLTKGYEQLGNSDMLGGLSGYKGYLAPRNRNQQYGGDLAYGLAQSQHGKNYQEGILTSGGGYDAQGYGANTVSMDSILTGAQPYLDTMGRSRLDEVDRTYDRARAQAAAQAANGVAMGGSGSAIREGQLTRGQAQERGSVQDQAIADAIAMSQGLLTNNAQMLNEADQFNASSGNRASEFGLTQGLNAQIAANSAQNDNVSRDLDIIQGLLTSGASEQAFEQALADMPWTNWQRYMSALPTPGSTQTTNKPQTFDPIAFALSLIT